MGTWQRGQTQLLSFRTKRIKQIPFGSLKTLALMILEQRSYEQS